MFKKQRPPFKPSEMLLIAAPLLVIVFWFVSARAKSALDSRSSSKLTSLPTNVAPQRGITSIAFSPDGGTLATSSEDGKIKLWNADTGALQRILRGKGKWASAVAFSPDGRMLGGASGSSLFLWSLPTGRLLKVLTAVQPHISSVAFSPNNRLVAAGCGTSGLYRGSGAICLWQIETGAPAVLTGNVAYVGSVAFSPDGKSLAATSGVNRTTTSKPNPIDLVRSWNLKTKMMEWEVQAGFVEGDVAFSPDGKLLAVGDSAPVLLMARTGKTATPLARLEGSGWHLAFSPDGQTLASCGVGTSPRFWDVSRRNWIDQGNGLDHSYATALAFSADGKCFVSGDSEGVVKTWDVSQLNQRRQLATPNLSSHLKLLWTLDTVKSQILAAKKP